MSDQGPLYLERVKLQNYLESVYKTKVTVVDVKELSVPEEDIKGHGYGSPLLLDIDIKGSHDRLVLHTVRPDKYGHEQRSDRARSILFDYDTFNKLSKHVPALSVGSFTQDGGLKSLDDTGEFFLITKYIPGRLYVEDLKNLPANTPILPEDRERVLALAEYLVDIHSQKHDHPSLYRRCIRDLLGHGEGIMGLIDSYPPDLSIATPSRLQAIEKRLIDWRWRLKEQGHRLSQIHGDFHPWNIMFNINNDFTVLDRSRNEFGEPADDVSALSINFIFFSLQINRSLAGKYMLLHQLFWDHYIQNSHDLELNKVIQPFYAWRALVLAHPTWYPKLELEIREKLFNFIEQILEIDWFEPKQINRYLGESP